MILLFPNKLLNNQELMNLGMMITENDWQFPKTSNNNHGV